VRSLVKVLLCYQEGFMLIHIRRRAKNNVPTQHNDISMVMPGTEKILQASYTALVMAFGVLC
jgi:hypothetical protein